MVDDGVDCDSGDSWGSCLFDDDDVIEIDDEFFQQHDDPGDVPDTEETPAVDIRPDRPSVSDVADPRSAEFLTVYDICRSVFEFLDLRSLMPCRYVSKNFGAHARHALLDRFVRYAKRTRESPIGVAVRSDNPFIIRCMLDDPRMQEWINADVRIGPVDTGTPLMLCAMLENARMMRALLTQSAVDVNAINEHGQSALYLAALYSHVHAQCVDLLLADPRTDINLRVGPKREPILSFAIEYNRNDLVGKLLQHPRVQLCDVGTDEHPTAFHLSRDPETLSLLLRNITVPMLSIADTSGSTPLHCLLRAKGLKPNHVAEIERRVLVLIRDQVPDDVLHRIDARRSLFADFVAYCRPGPLLDYLLLCGRISLDLQGATLADIVNNDRCWERILSHAAIEQQLLSNPYLVQVCLAHAIQDCKNGKRVRFVCDRFRPDLNAFLPIAAIDVRHRVHGPVTSGMLAACVSDPGALRVLVDRRGIDFTIRNGNGLTAVHMVPNNALHDTHREYLKRMVTSELLAEVGW
ncbi:Ankyrin repeat domain-containing protein [Plasmodiophora brassicae]